MLIGHSEIRQCLFVLQSVFVCTLLNIALNYRSTGLRLPIAWLTAFMHRFSISAFPGLLPPTWGWNRRERVRNGRFFSNASSCRTSHHVLVQVSHLLLQLRWLYVGIRHSNHNNTSKHKHKSVSFNDYCSFISSIVLHTVQYTLTIFTKQ